MGCALVATGFITFGCSLADDPLESGSGTGGVTSTGGLVGTGGAQVTSGGGGNTAGGNGGSRAGSGGGAGRAGSSADTRWTACGKISPTKGASVHFVGKGDSVVLLQTEGPALLRPLDRSLPSRELPANTKTISADGELLVTEDMTVSVRRVSDFSLVSEIVANTAACPNVAGFSPNAEVLFMSGPAAWCVFDTASGMALMELPVVQPPYVKLNGSDVLVQSSDGAVGEGRVATPIELTRYPLDGSASARLELNPLAVDGSEPEKRFVALAPNGATLASVTLGAETLSCALWDTRSGSKLWSLDRPVSTLSLALQNRLAFGADAPIAPGFSADGHLATLCRSIVDTQTLESRELRLENEQFLGGAELSPDGKRAAPRIPVRGQIDIPGLLDLETAFVEVLSGHAALERSPGGMTGGLSLSQDGSLLASHGLEVLVFELAEKFEESVPTYHGDWGAERPSVEISPDGHWLSVFGDGRLVQDLKQNRLPTWLADDPSDADASNPCWPEARFSPDGEWVAGVTWLPELTLYRTADLTRDPDAMDPSSFIQPAVTIPLARCANVAFSADGKQLLTSDLARFTLSGELVAAGKTSQVDTSADYRRFSDRTETSRDGRWLVTSQCYLLTGPCTTTLYTADGQLVRKLSKLSSRFPSFSADGEWIGAGNKLLHLQSDTVVTMEPNVVGLVFHPKGDIIAATSDFDLLKYCPTR